MQNEISGVAKLGIVLIALAVLIGLGFGIFQISKGTANTGVNDVQHELDDVQDSHFSTYDQSVISGAMVKSVIPNLKGGEVAVLISTQAFIDLLGNTDAEPGDTDDLYTDGSGINQIYNDGSNELSKELPIVWVYTDKNLSNNYNMQTSSGEDIKGAFINYNALLGNKVSNSTGCVSAQKCMIDNTEYTMGGIYFDSNKFVCDSGFMMDSGNKVQYNITTVNMGKTGTTEFIPDGALFQSYLIKDSSGTIVGIAVQEIGRN